MDIFLAGLTDVGKVRSHNEDAYVTLGGQSCPPSVDCLAAVADGMGGHAAGEVASQMTVEGLVRLMNLGASATEHPTGIDYSRFLGRVIEQVNKEVYEAGQDQDKRGMGTTCTAAVMRGDQLFLSHVGDSRAYLLRNGELHQVTRDHSWVEEAVQGGVLSRDEARTHPNRNIITRALGLDPNVTVDNYTLSADAGDILMLCSDGLNSMVPDEEIHDILMNTEPDRAPETLVAAANSYGGHDNITVIVAALGSRTKPMHRSNAATANSPLQKTVSILPWWERIIKTLFR